MKTLGKAALAVACVLVVAWATGMHGTGDAWALVTALVVPLFAVAVAAVARGAAGGYLAQRAGQVDGSVPDMSEAIVRRWTFGAALAVCLLLPGAHTAYRLLLPLVVALCWVAVELWYSTPGGDDAPVAVHPDDSSDVDGAADADELADPEDTADTEEPVEVEDTADADDSAKADETADADEPPETAPSASTGRRRGRTDAIALSEVVGTAAACGVMLPDQLEQLRADVSRMKAWVRRQLRAQVPADEADRLHEAAFGTDYVHVFARLTELRVSEIVAKVHRCLEVVRRAESLRH